MVLTEAFASGTPVVASAIAGYNDVVTDGHDGLLVPVGDAVELGESLRSLALDWRGARGWRRPRARARSACVAAGCGRGDRGLRAGARGARSGHAQRTGRPADRHPVQRARCARFRRSACPRSAVRPRRGPRARGRRAASWSAPARSRVWASPRSRSSGSASSRSAARCSRPRPSGCWPRLRSCAPRCCCAPRPGTRSCVRRCPGPRQAPRHRPGTMIGVLMSATLPARLGEPSRALLIVAACGQDARALPGRARHDGFPDDAQHPRARPPRKRDVRDRRALPGQRGRARRRHDRPGRSALVLVLRRPGSCAAASRRASSASSRPQPPPAARWSRCGIGSRSSASRSSAAGPR